MFGPRCQAEKNLDTVVLSGTKDNSLEYSLLRDSQLSLVEDWWPGYEFRGVRNL